ncbi:MAG: fasciclin domain-containing protein [Gemmatimonadetes bacterium]|nr:fasciclin domain-containing protein [Gemmatimonadota bacterium]
MSRHLHWTATLACLLLAACGRAAQDQSADAAEGAPPAGGQAAVEDSTSTPSVVRIAVGSKDHTTLVTALQAAKLVDPLANPGPFTVFAPTNAAFDKLPAGTVASLLEPGNVSQLKEVLQHHVTTSALDVDAFTDGQELGMVSGGTERITKKDGSTFIGSAKIVASVRASNGWVHVIDAVLVPPAK